MTTGTWFWMVALLCFSGLLLGGCGEDTTMPGADVARLDEHRTLGAPIAAENLTVWPVYTDAPLDVGEFLTLHEAQEKRLAVVRELGGTATNDAGQQRTGQQRTGQVRAGQVREGQDLANLSAGAQVNKVVIENKGDLPILVCAGTIITGGKQDRQIGQDFVIAANTTVDVDAFCVEQGRWHTGRAQATEEVQGLEQRLAEARRMLNTLVDARSRAQRATEIAALQEERDAKVATVNSLQFAAHGSTGIAPKAVRAAGQYEKDQGKVWESVTKELAADQAFATPSSTFLAKLEQASEETVAQRERIESKVAEAFAKLAAMDRKPVGFAYAVNGKPVTVRTFAHERILRSQLPAFLKAMAMEAQDAAGAKDAKTKAAASDVIAMVRGLEDAKEELTETRAGNDNGYRSSDAAFNARCYLKRAGVPQDVVLTEDWTAK